MYVLSNFNGNLYLRLEAGAKLNVLLNAVKSLKLLKFSYFISMCLKLKSEIFQVFSQDNPIFDCQFILWVINKNYDETVKNIIWQFKKCFKKILRVLIELYKNLDKKNRLQY